MNKIFLIFLSVFLIFLISDAYSNPFAVGNEDSGSYSIEKKSHDKTILLKITLMQQNLKIKLSGLIYDLKEGKSILPFFSIIMISFLYGVLHAAGPGHGKTFAAGYILSEKPKLSKGIIFGSSIAFFHGISGAFLVLILNLILKKTISGSMAQIEYITKLTSFSLLSLLGGILVLKSIGEIFFKSKKKEGSVSKNIFLWGFSAGVIPCPGVIMIMLFCLSLGMPYFGFLLAFAVSSGMALTIIIVVLSIAVGKKFSYSFLSDEKIEKGEQFFGFLSGILVFTAGIIFLLSTLNLVGNI